MPWPPEPDAHEEPHAAEPDLVAWSDAHDRLDRERIGTGQADEAEGDVDDDDLVDEDGASSTGLPPTAPVEATPPPSGA